MFSILEYNPKNPIPNSLFVNINNINVSFLLFLDAIRNHLSTLSKI